MLSNDVLRRIRYALNLNDTAVVKLFRLGDLAVTRAQLAQWFKKEEDPDFVSCKNSELSAFLNGLIIEKRGAKEDSPPPTNVQLNNNAVLMKLKIALSLQSDDMLEILQLAGFQLSKHELSALFRKPDHKHYRECQDQLLRNFLKGLALKFRRESNLKQSPNDASLKVTASKHNTQSKKKHSAPKSNSGKAIPDRKTQSPSTEKKSPWGRRSR